MLLVSNFSVTKNKTNEKENFKKRNTKLIDATLKSEMEYFFL